MLGYVIYTACSIVTSIKVAVLLAGLRAVQAKTMQPAGASRAQPMVRKPLGSVNTVRASDQPLKDGTKGNADADLKKPTTKATVRGEAQPLAGKGKERLTARPLARDTNKVKSSGTAVGKAGNVNTKVRFD